MNPPFFPFRQLSFFWPPVDPPLLILRYKHDGLVKSQEKLSLRPRTLSGGSNLTINNQLKLLYCFITPFPANQATDHFLRDHHYWGRSKKGFFPVMDKGMPMMRSESRRPALFAAAPTLYIIRLSIFSSPASFTADPRAIPISTAWNMQTGPVKSSPSRLPAARSSLQFL